MKAYVDYMNSIPVSAELHEKIMQQVTKRPAPRLLPLASMRYVRPAACAAVLVLCALAIPNLFRKQTDGSKSVPERSALIIAPNENHKTGEERAPETYTLTLQQAKSDANFGAYVPNAPPQFKFKSAQRLVDPDGDSLCVIWDETDGSDNSINWKISMLGEPDHIVYSHEREKYDMALYSDPFIESVPEELWECFKNPVFPVDELTQDTVSARAYRSARDIEEAHSYHMAFSVLYGDVLIRVDTNGATPEQLFEMLTGGVARGPDEKASFKEKTGAMDDFKSAAGN